MKRGIPELRKAGFYVCTIEKPTKCSQLYAAIRITNWIKDGEGYDQMEACVESMTWPGTTFQVTNETKTNLYFICILYIRERQIPQCNVLLPQSITNETMHSKGKHSFFKKKRAIAKICSNFPVGSYLTDGEDAGLNYAGIPITWLFSIWRYLLESFVPTESRARESTWKTQDLNSAISQRQDMLLWQGFCFWQPSCFHTCLAPSHI